ncbi:translation initiation factor eIF5B [Saccharomycopsis crataegensis]|uniref:Eukaryotic translation initiation factor 5B n=1 Tax=Saccharomycopsis crataegensis TaxID=43959 RepID=A0AAV5QJK6_9ASCO|nr:translation initiation factor eIF5B [Saccharomycopsis crataegensis]
MSEGDGPQDFMSVLKQTKAKQEEKKVVIKSKKEKEKEKKEKEKQRKKELAAKKKAKQQEQKAQQAAQNQKNADDAAKAKEEKNSKKADSDSPRETPAPASAAAGKKGKGKKINPAIAALRKQMELRKQQEEEERLLQEEEERLAKEEEEKRIAEEKQLEEQKKLKKEKEKARIERLKAEGKFLTKKQKEEKKLQERRKQQLLQSGNVSVAGLKADGSKESTQKKKIVYGDKKKKSSAERAAEKAKKEEEARKKAEEEAAKAAAAKAEEEDEDDDLIDDWEAMALDDDEEEEEEEQTATGEDWSAKAEEEEKESSEEKQNESSETPASTSAEPVYAEEIEEISTPGAAAKSSGKNDLRSPICCILGHVDTGKTKLLDKIRQTNVQGGEAGGITQQIGATYFPMTAIKQKTKVMEKFEENISFQVPGLLIIDTPGHESFTNLRSRGSSLCNIAILVIDIMHGLEQQTIESIRLLRDRKAPFIVALNKIDRLYGWEVSKDNSFRDSFAQQTQAVKSEFEDRLSKIKVQLAEQGLNSELYFQNKNMAKFVSIVPTSAVTGEGVPDLLWLLLELTTKRMSKQLMYLSEVEATILEVKVVEGFGYTIDVVLNNGILREGDRVVLCGLNGPIVTNIRALLTPQPLRELRIKSDYVHNKEVKAALGVKIAANDLEKAVAGSRLLVVGPEDDEEELMDEVMDDLTGLLNSVDSSGRGVTVQASTLGSLEALLSFLKDMKIPVMSVGLGPVFKRDVMKATTMSDKAPEYAVMLCFDVKIDKEAEQYAEEHKITIFNAEIIYHLFDAFTAYQEKLLEEKRKNFMEFAIFPCVLNTIQIINKRNPMIIGVDVAEGSVRIGTPICAVKINPETKQRDVLLLGKVVSLEVNHNSQNIVKKGQTAQGVAMRLEGPSGAQPVWGRHVDEKDKLYSLISRKSIDTLKDAAFRDQVPREDWLLIKALKPVFDIK